MNNTDNLTMGTLAAFFVFLMCSIAMSFADDSLLTERVYKELGRFSVEVYEHSDKCVRVYHVLDEQNYLACDTPRGIEYTVIGRG